VAAILEKAGRWDDEIYIPPQAPEVAPGIVPTLIGL